ncbi:MAG TPA: hypothetical protein VFI31_16855, partial [Pirellulales bacterium]|nr:hypothetical protein [Pirellulales bacterium]
METYLADRATKTKFANRDDVRVCQVQGRRQREAFIRLPWKIYAGDPQWVAPLLMERREFIDAKRHPFYLHGAAVPLLAYRGDE